MTFVALFDREDWGIIAADTSARIKIPEPGIPPVAWRVIEDKDGVSKLFWHPGGWMSFCGVGTAWAIRLLPAIDALPALEPLSVGAALRTASGPVIDEVRRATPQLADHIKDKSLWFVLGAPRAVVLNWRGDDLYGEDLRGRLAACWPPEITDADARPFINEASSALQTATQAEAVRVMGRLHGQIAALSGSLKGVSQECEIGFLERGPTPRHLHIPATDWRLVAAGKVEPVVVTDRASTRRSVRREGA